MVSWPARVGNSRRRTESYPHEWTHERSCRPEDFTRAIECIERWGVVERFWGSRRKYLHVDGRQYWHMGNFSSNDPDKRPTLINRAWIEVGNYREHARALGYDGERLERLVVRWTVLLEKAHRGG